MKKNIYNVLFLSALVFCIAACAEYQIPAGYDGSPAIYFSWDSQAKEQHDSINHSFFLQKDYTQTTDTVWVKINVLGSAAPVNRPIAIVQTNTGKANAAVAGTHFLSFDDPWVKEKMMIPANSVQTSIPIVVRKDPSLDLHQVRLELSVVENEHFRPGIDAYRNFLVTTTAQAVNPSIWDSRWRYIFGPTWGTVKFRFMIDATGYLDWEIVPTDNGYLTWLQSTVLQKFAEYNLNHPDNPLREANGDLVTFN
jgi:hypothetical protein